MIEFSLLLVWNNESPSPIGSFAMLVLSVLDGSAGDLPLNKEIEVYFFKYRWNLRNKLVSWYYFKIK